MKFDFPSSKRIAKEQKEAVEKENEKEINGINENCSDAG